MSTLQNGVLCMLGTGNLGTAILKCLLASPSQDQLFTKHIACVQSKSSQMRLTTQFPEQISNFDLTVSVNDNLSAVHGADVVILALDPSAIAKSLSQPGIREALGGKLLISVAAGWTRQGIEEVLYGSASTSGRDNQTEKATIIRTLPNIAALVGQSLTAIEVDSANPPPSDALELTDLIFARVGTTLHIAPSLIDATTAVAGSTPAMFAVIVDAMVDAAVAVGVPRALAQAMVYQSMAGTAGMLKSGVSPGSLKEQGTSPEGCTIGGLMVMEEKGVRGGVGRAVREAVTIARLMDGGRHVNDTRE
ncbi:pyrroline-5-carboxylate reductase [Aspergillus undulatus]|uniref:pyrroline-5-carboxylate reductase n=1 Tax=Aspergillus undulatus TaxID=1810928 RepID=UPI003CCCC8B6